MSTTVEDLICLKDEAVAACYSMHAAWERGEDAMDEIRAVIERAELYDVADADEDACSIEDHERLESLCELEDCPVRDPDGKRSHTQRECEAE